MSTISEQFLSAHLSAFPPRAVFTAKSSKEMMASAVDESGWFEWKPITGNLPVSAYREIERAFNIKFPRSFIEWHKEFFFLDGDCSILRLPASSPIESLQALKKNLDWFIPQQLIPQNLYPFGDEGNDSGPLVFDARRGLINDDFPVCVYDQSFGGSLEGLSKPIFSSFSKLLDCIIYFMIALNTKKRHEIIPRFFEIDPEGAGKTGLDYWLAWRAGFREEYEDFGN
jgi:hypothetical protein